MIRALIVDDEAPARDRLRMLLAAFDDVEVVGEAGDGEEAMARIAELSPDVVLLDVQMPGCSGMELAASLPEPRPRLVFCTAYEEYAVDAFEVHAVDYLLKPVNRARLAAALERVRRPPDSGALDRVAAGSVGGPTRFLAKRRNRYHVVPRDDVLYLAADGGATRLQTADGHSWMQPPLQELERRLDPRLFARVSRGAIVRLDAVREMRPLDGGGAELLLVDGSTLEVSRRRYRELLERIAGA